MAIDFDTLTQKSEDWVDRVATRTVPNALAVDDKTVTELETQIIATPMLTIGELEIIVNEFIARRDNPNLVTKQQVGLGKVSNYSVATALDMVDGTKHDSYVTPALVKAAFDNWFSGLTGGEGNEELLQAIEDLQNLFGSLPTDLTDLMTAIAGKLDRVETAADSHAFGGISYNEFVTTIVPAIIVAESLDAQKLQGKTWEEMTATYADILTGVEEKFVTAKLLRQSQLEMVDPLTEYLGNLYQQGAQYLRDEITEIDTSVE